MELNREQIIKALDCCLVESNCTGCPLHHQYETDCLKYAGKKALSLINELTEENESLGALNEHNDLVIEGKLERISALERKVLKLTEENERLKGRNEHLTECLDIEDKYKERLRDILLQFTDIVHKWGNKNGYDTSEIALVPILNEESAIKSEIEADTVRKVKELILKGIGNRSTVGFGFIETMLEEIEEDIIEGGDTDE